MAHVTVEMVLDAPGLLVDGRLAGSALADVESCNLTATVVGQTTNGHYDVKLEGARVDIEKFDTLYYDGIKDAYVIFD